MAVSIKINTKSLDRLIKSLKNENVKVGIFDEEVAIYASVQEYGSLKQNIPPRSFLRSTESEKFKDWEKLIQQDVINQIESGKFKYIISDSVFDQIIQDFKDKIDMIFTPPLKPSTIKSKGHDKPLIDSGRMKESITFRRE